MSGTGLLLLEAEEIQQHVLPAELAGPSQEAGQLFPHPLALGGRGWRSPGWEKPLRGAWGGRGAGPAAHLAVQAGGGVLGRAALPPDFLGSVVYLAEEGVGDAGVSPRQLKHVPGAGKPSLSQRYPSQTIRRTRGRDGWGRGWLRVPLTSWRAEPPPRCRPARWWAWAPRAARGRAPVAVTRCRSRSA